MSEIKTTIALLCKLLKILYGCDIKNENFRLAKFNKTEECTVNHFWKLLYKICSIECNNNAFTDGNIINFVKLSLACMQYERVEFYSLPNDMTFGSRELLLAFSWLLASQNIIEKAVRRRIMECSISKEYHCSDATEIKEKNESESVVNVKNLHDACESVLWYTGKVHKNLKIIEDLAQELASITHKIHEETRDICGIPHLSAGDAKLIHEMHNQTSDGYEYLKDGTSLIENRALWLKKETVYWQWMETVIEERAKESSQELGMDSRCSLLSFMQVLKTTIEGDISQRKSGSESINQLSENSEGIISIPRKIFHEELQPTELENLSSELSKHLEQLRTEYNSRSGDVKCFLDELSKKMHGIIVLNI